MSGVEWVRKVSFNELTKCNRSGIKLHGGEPARRAGDVPRDALPAELFHAIGRIRASVFGLAAQLYGELCRPLRVFGAHGQGPTPKKFGFHTYSAMQIINSLRRPTGVRRSAIGNIFSFPECAIIDAPTDRIGFNVLAFARSILS